MVRSFTRRGEDEEVLPAIDRCLEADPDDSHCLAAQAWVDLRARSLDEAAVVTAHLERTAPDALDTLVLTASVAKARGDLATACERYAAACKRGQPFACAEQHRLCPR